MPSQGNPYRGASSELSLAVLAREHHWAVPAIGVALLPGAALGAVVSRAAGRRGDRAGPVLAGSALIAGVFPWLAWAVDANAMILVVGAAFSFAAGAAAQVVLTGLMATHLPPERRGSAMGVLNMTYFVGGGLAPAFAGALAHSLDVVAALALVSSISVAAGLLALRLRPSASSSRGSA